MTEQQLKAWKAAEAALEKIASPGDCGCVPCRGQCRSEFNLSLELDERRDIASEALALLRSTDTGDDWEGIETAPKDGTRFLLWCVHPNARFDPVNYAGPVIGRWIKHNGGGFTWEGHSGDVTHWQPLPQPPVGKVEG